LNFYIGGVCEESHPITWSTTMTTRNQTEDALRNKAVRRSGPDGSPGKPLADRRVAVTGGTAGLGLALVREFRSRGAQVAFVARNRDGVQRVMREYPDVHGIVGDVSNKEQIHPLAVQILGALGGLDVLINNASSLGPVPLELLADTECEDLERALATNVLGPFRLTKALLGSLAASAREGRRAAVLNVSSDAAIHPYAQWGAYGASKAALNHLTRIWDEELKSMGIRFLSIDPGDMDTALHRAALPDADPSTLKHAEVAARELADAVTVALTSALDTLERVHEDLDGELQI
jgi:NAD(P)-dependent dehydrogenase (short-subunit alcohol dehydrogenase family)